MKAFVSGGFSSYKVILKKTIKYTRVKTFTNKLQLKMKMLTTRIMGKLKKQ